MIWTIGQVLGCDWATIRQSNLATLHTKLPTLTPETTVCILSPTNSQRRFILTNTTIFPAVAPTKPNLNNTGGRSENTSSHIYCFWKALRNCFVRMKGAPGGKLLIWVILESNEKRPVLSLRLEGLLL